ncbi:hypothetical protein Dimus_010552 [Dionaea muscipula]
MNQIPNLQSCSSPRSSKSFSSRFLAPILVIVVVFLVTLFFTLYIVKAYRRRKQSSQLETWKLTSFQKLYFTEATILSSLQDDNVIWSGGSGKVYRIAKNRSGGTVAVKKEYKLLVYEYMENESLDKWLHGRKRKSTPSDVVLNWPTRMKIAIGAAQGLCYMHHDCSPPAVHRDIKPSNILLDSMFNPKIADFGLAK